MTSSSFLDQVIFEAVEDETNVVVVVFSCFLLLSIASVPETSSSSASSCFLVREEEAIDRPLSRISNLSEWESLEFMGSVIKDSNFGFEIWTTKKKDRNFRKVLEIWEP